MKKLAAYFSLPLIAALALAGTAGVARAQMMGRYGANGYGYMTGGWEYPSSSAGMSASDTQAIAAGQALYRKLQTGKAECGTLTQDDFESLGEYFMQQMTGSGHAAMDSAMSSMMGEEGDTAMHIAMGERYSGCYANAALPGAWSGSGNKYYGFMPMMGYYGGYGYGPMMGYGWGGEWFGWIFMVIFWIVAIIVVVTLVRLFVHGGRRGWRGWHGNGRSALDILKERYAKGEIDRKEFEEKKKDLEF